MCLDTIEKFEPCKVGFKAVRVRKGKLYSPCAGDLGKVIRRGVWLDEKDYRHDYHSTRKVIRTYDFRYPFGFHVFHNREDAEMFRVSNEIIVKVALREPRTTGIQSEWRITVAKQIRILPDEK